MRRRVTAINQKNKLFVAVGRNGIIVTSPDGKEWTKRDSRTSNDLTGVSYGNGLYVAVGTDIILTSPDGIEWTQRPYSGFVMLAGSTITYGNGAFIAVANTYGISVIIRSTDGVNWTISATHTAFIDITFGNNLFIGAGYSGQVGISPDGINWTISPTGIDQRLQAITYGNGLYVAVGAFQALATSPDAINWTIREVEGYWYGVAYGNGLYVALGFSDLLTSADGLSWSYSNDGPTIYTNSLIYTNNLFIGVGSERGVDSRIATSSTGLPRSWSVIDAGGERNQQLQAITYRDK